MADCPQCFNSVNEEFGLVTCSHCGVSFFLDLDGLVSPTEALLSSTSHSFESENLSSLEDSFLHGNEESISAVESINSFHSNQNEILESSFSPKSTDLLSARESSEGLSFPLDSSTMSTEEMLGEVIAFAHSSKMESKEGRYRYSIKISDIDTKDLFRQVVEALEDDRFLWDIDQVMTHVKQGVLVLEDLSPLKASLIVRRLLDVDVQVYWIQSEIHSRKREE